MASYTLDESIIGVPLFVPDDRDFFSVDVGGMPNGDDCLIVHGDVDDNYLAYQPVQTISPEIFTSKSPTDWSMSFWYKSATLPAVATEHTLIAVGNVSAPDWPATTGASNSGNGLWRVTTRREISPTRYGLIANCIVNNTGNAQGNRRTGMIEDLDDGQWHLLVFNFPARLASGSVTPTAFRDLQTTVDNGGSANNTSAGTVAIVPPHYFSIGALSTFQSALPMEWRIGKLAFHDHLLNATERALLYNAMTN